MQTASALRTQRRNAKAPCGWTTSLQAQFCRSKSRCPIGRQRAHTPHNQGHCYALRQRQVVRVKSHFILTDCGRNRMRRRFESQRSPRRCASIEMTKLEVSLDQDYEPDATGRGMQAQLRPTGACPCARDACHRTRSTQYLPDFAAGFGDHGLFCSAAEGFLELWQVLHHAIHAKLFR